MKQITVKLDSFSTSLRLLPLEELSQLTPGTSEQQVLWVTDQAIWATLTGPTAPQDFRRALAPLMHPDDRLQACTDAPQTIPRTATNVLVIAAGEDNKSWEQVSAIINAGFERGLARDSYIIGLGGGVVCDMAAFAASLFMRGCRLILIPTTLLAQVDASLGGKTGINFGGYKNMVGTFYPATEVRIIPALNRTLSQQEFLSGLGEVIKHAYLADPALLQLLRSQPQKIIARSEPELTEMVWNSLLVKARIVEQDFTEQSIRAHLNLVHTFAHGLESAAGLGSWSHGEAVAWGMVQAARLALRLDLCSSQYCNDLIHLIESYGYRTAATNVSIDKLLQAMLMDKKKKGGSVRFVLQRGEGDTIMQAVAESDLRAILTAQ